MSSRDKNSVGIVCWSKHLLIERMVYLLPDDELAEALRRFPSSKTPLLVASKPVPDVFKVLFLLVTNLTHMVIGVDLPLNSGFQTIDLLETIDQLSSTLSAS